MGGTPSPMCTISRKSAHSRKSQLERSKTPCTHHIVLSILKRSQSSERSASSTQSQCAQIQSMSWAFLLHHSTSLQNMRGYQAIVPQADTSKHIQTSKNKHLRRRKTCNMNRPASNNALYSCSVVPWDPIFQVPVLPRACHHVPRP